MSAPAASALGQIDQLAAGDAYAFRCSCSSTAVKRAYIRCMAVLPKNFKGPLPWSILDNRIENAFPALRNRARGRNAATSRSSIAANARSSADLTAQQVGGPPSVSALETRGRRDACPHGSAAIR